MNEQERSRWLELAAQLEGYGHELHEGEELEPPYVLSSRADALAGARVALEQLEELAGVSPICGSCDQATEPRGAFVTCTAEPGRPVLRFAGFYCAHHQNRRLRIGAEKR